MYFFKRSIPTCFYTNSSKFILSHKYIKVNKMRYLRKNYHRNIFFLSYSSSSISLSSCDDHDFKEILKQLEISSSLRALNIFTNGKKMNQYYVQDVVSEV